MLEIENPWIRGFTQGLKVGGSVDDRNR